MGKRILLLSVFLLIAAFGANAQQNGASVNGYVRDANTGETLISANVALLENNRGASTNTLGYFTIPGIQPGTYTLACSYIGFELYRQEITLEPGQNLRIDIELQPEVFQGEEIRIEATAEEEREQKNIGIAQVETELIKALPSVFEADVFRSIQLLPGVKAASDFSSGLYIRGGSPDQTLILLDRTTVYNPSHFFGFFSTFNPDAIKDVRLYKGGYPAEYGGRLGSVLTIYNKDGNRKELAGTATLGMLASRVALEGPYSKGSWMIAARRSTLEPLLAALRQSTDGVPDLFYFLDFNGKVNYDANESNKFNLAVYTGKDRVTFPFATDAEFGLNYGNQTISSNWTHIFNEHLFSNFVVTGSRYFNYPSFDFGGTEFTRSNNIWDYSIKSDIEYLPNNQHQISSGIWAGTFTFKIEDTFDGSVNFKERIHNRYASVYVQDEWEPSDLWVFTPGVRVNYFSDGDYIRVEPRFSMEYRPFEWLRLQAAAGRYNQFLTLISNEAFSGFDIWLTSDDGISPAYGDQIVLGAKTIPFEGYGLDVEVYYRTMKDLFELDPFLPDAAGLAYPDLFRIGEGYAYGIEVFFERRVGKFTGFIGYTNGYTWRKFPGFNYEIGDEDKTARFYPPKYDRQHDVKILANYQLSKKWKTTTSFAYATGQSYTVVHGRYEVQDLPWTNEVLDVFTVGNVNASRLPPYLRMDLAFTRHGRFFNIGDSELQLQIINVFSRRNVWFYQFDTDSNPIERTDILLLPIIPSLSYTVNF